MRALWIVLLGGCNGLAGRYREAQIGALGPEPAERALGSEFEIVPLIEGFPQGVWSRPTAQLDCSAMWPGVDFRISGAESSDPLGEGLVYHFRVIRSPNTPEPYVLTQNSDDPATWFILNAFGGPWEFGLRVEDSRGRVSEEATCRMFRRYHARLVVELSWPLHESTADLDIHVVQSWANLWDIPGDCHYANPWDDGWSIDPGSPEDDCVYLVDNRGGEDQAGPGEVMLFPNPQEGAMDIVIDEFRSGAPEANEEPVMVRIWLDNRLIYDTLERRPSEEWWVARVDLKTNTATRLDPPYEGEE